MLAGVSSDRSAEVADSPAHRMAATTGPEVAGAGQAGLVFLRATIKAGEVFVAGRSSEKMTEIRCLLEVEAPCRASPGTEFQSPRRLMEGDGRDQQKMECPATSAIGVPWASIEGSLSSARPRRDDQR